MVFVAIGVLLIFAGAFYLFLAIRSRKPDNLVSVTGELVRLKEYRPYRGGRNIIYPFANEYAYAYYVGEKRYLFQGVELRHKRELFKRVTIVYLRGFPRIACVDCFTAYRERGIGISFCILGLCCSFLQLLINVS